MPLIETPDGGFILDESDCQPPYKVPVEDEENENSSDVKHDKKKSRRSKK